MLHTRRLWALSALLVTLVLGACSTPDDLNTPTLEPQFGTAGEDTGFRAAITSTGSIVTLSEERGARYNSDWEVNTTYENLTWQRYDSNGLLAWSTSIASRDCGYYDRYSYYCDRKTIKPMALLRGSNGATYAVFSQEYSYSYTTDTPSQYDISYRAYKLNASGDHTQTIRLGELYSYSDNDGFIRAAIDGSGNLYVAKVVSDSASGSRKNVIAKYNTNGSLAWQRLSNVGIPTSISVAGNGNIFIGGTTGYSRLTNSGSVAWTKTGATDEVLASGTSVYVRYRTTVRKHDTNGGQLWSRSQSGFSSMVVASMTADSNGNLYLAGKYNLTDTNRDAYTRKISSSGTTVWTKAYGTSSYDDALGIATVAGSDIYVTGSTQGDLGAGNQGGSDGYLRKMNSSGSLVWIR